MCGREKKREKNEKKKKKKEGKKCHVWRIKKEWKKGKKEEGNVITIFSQFFHNKF